MRKKLLSLAMATVLGITTVTAASVAMTQDVHAEDETVNKAYNIVMPEPWYTVIYTGEETNIDSLLILYDGESGKNLVKDVDYTLTYKDNIKVGTATVYITGIGEYEGYTNEVQYGIVKRTEESTQVTLTSYNATLYKSQQMKISAKVNGTVSDDVEWKSSNEKVAKVSEDGTVAAVAKGKAVITATYKNGDKSITASCTVSVKNYSTKMYSKVKKIRTKDYYTFDNELITSYSQMKKLINKYSKVNYDDSVMNKLKKYDKNYFKNKALCISTVNQRKNETISVGSVKKIMKANGKYTIKVSLNSKHISDAAVKKDKAAYNMVVEISKTVAGLSDKVVVK